MEDKFGPDTISAPIRTRPKHVIALRERDRDRRFEIPMHSHRWTIGKSDDCDFVLDNQYVSRMHATIERCLDGTLRLHDTSSKNGTYLDGSLVQSAELRPGAVIVLGRVYLTAIGEDDPDGALAQLRGCNELFLDTVDQARRAARSNCSVLLVGETGTGKELFARAIHEMSPRAYGPFVATNCGAFPRELIGSELFGHVRGAFTGALDARDGLFVQADGGTLFLDELGELPLDQQPNLLRALETRRVRPIGGVTERSVDARFVAATNRLEDLGTRQSALRFDLYHRLAAVVIKLPPLRRRRDDIADLARSFVRESGEPHAHRELLPSALDAMLNYDWPGNIRELRQAVARAIVMGNGDIEAEDLGLPRTKYIQDPPPPSPPLRAAEPGPKGSRHDLVMRDSIANAWAKHRSIRAAARELGMPKSTFAERARRYGIIPQATQDDP